MSEDKVGAVMVVGAGIGGMQAAMVMANSGFKVFLVEESPSIGGRMVQLDKTFPTNECSMCTITPTLVSVGRHPDIITMTNSKIKNISGTAGNFEVEVMHNPRYVDMDLCTGCGDCASACPVKVTDTFNVEMGSRSAVYIPFPQAVPLKFGIDRRPPSPCKVSCPANLSAQGYVALIAEGRYKEALEVVKDVMPLAGTIGRVCNHPCEFSCKRKNFESSVSIRNLKRFIADQEMESGEKVVPPDLGLESNGRKVAVVGAGPAGITCAYHLRRLGYEPTIFEALPVAGGMLKVGIPDYRLPPAVLDFEIKAVEDMGVDIKYGVKIGKDISIKELFDKGYESVFLGVGAHESMKLRIEGEDSKGVLPGVEFLRDVNLGNEVDTGKRVVVIGGGNVAIDAARSAWRLGAEKVTILYRRTRKEMPAAEEEIEDALKEGIEIEYLVAPVKVISENGKVTALDCIRMELGEPDKSGRRRPVPIEGSEFQIEIDSIIPAIGQASDLSLLEGLIDYKWTIEVNDDLSTSYPGLFAGGDAVTGPKMVIDAIAQGRKAAWSIDKYLNNGENTAVPPLLEYADIAKAEYYLEDDIEEVQRHELDLLPVEERKSNFTEVELGFAEDKAKAEASRCLKCGVCARCGICEIVCQPKALKYRDEETTETLKVGAVVVASGYDLFEPALKSEYGYQECKNVVSALQYERVMAPTGPSGGHIYRPSDHQTPKKVAWLQCVGSRDKQAGNEYCSAVCCTYATKEAIITREDIPESECTIFFMDMRTFGKGFEEFYNRAKEEYGVKYVRSRVAHIEEVENNNLKVIYRDEDGTPRQEVFDMVVLSAGLRPRAEFHELIDVLGVERNEYGFVKTDHFTPMVTNKEGIFVAGSIQEPKDIPDTVAQSIGVVTKATSLIKDVRGTELADIGFPPELELDEEPRIGVFVCHCGVNIGSVIDVPIVAEYAKKLPNVVFAEDNLFTCSGDTQVRMKELIKEHKLNRVVVASCTPRTHEPLFQETLRGAGINAHLFDLVSIREHCSWVHRDTPEVATEKAKLLVTMAIDKVSRNLPVQKEGVEIVRKALVIGGGISGMNAALDIADQGFETFIVEKERELGGNMRNIPHLFTDLDPQEYMNDLMGKIEGHPQIKVFTNHRLSDLSGYIGNFEAKVTEITGNPTSGTSQELNIGAIVVAVGAQELKPEGLFGYGTSPRIMTQLEFDKALVDGTLDKMGVNNVVMIQCVGSREGSDGERPYCSRVCCSTAVKNALKFTDGSSDRQVLVLYRDIRTYGFKEKYYREARGRGIVFTRYLQESPPEVTVDGDNVKIDFDDLIINRKFTTQPDLIVLSAATVPFKEDNIELAQLLKVPLTLNNFFLEAHTKIAPLDFATDGVFLCGTCHGPKFSEEAVYQASGAAARAISIISQDSIATEGIPSMIDELRCVGCGLCEANCAYNAIKINEERGIAEVNEILCKGCGACQAVCPSSVPYNRQFGVNQIMRMIETATEEAP
jgi:heterodisulfide reductase subunit A-like polyferredoxin